MPEELKKWKSEDPTTYKDEWYRLASGAIAGGLAILAVRTGVLTRGEMKYAVNLFLWAMGRSLEERSK